MHFRAVCLVAFCSLGMGCAHQIPPLSEPAKITDSTRAVACEKGTELSRGTSFQTYTAAWCQRPDGTRHGQYVDWWENGMKKSAGNYREGRRDGLWTFFRETGEVDSRIEYRDGAQPPPPPAP